MIAKSRRRGKIIDSPRDYLAEGSACWDAENTLNPCSEAPPPWVTEPMLDPAVILLDKQFVKPFARLDTPGWFKPEPGWFGCEHFSMWWWCDLTASRLTWTGIGTTIRGPFPECWPPECRFADDAPPVVSPALTLFHFARRFWNHIFTWTSDNLRACAMCDLSVRLRYFFAWNSRSSSRSCSDVNAVLRRRALLALPLPPELPPLPPRSPAPWPPPSGPIPSSSLSGDTRPFSDSGIRDNWSSDL